MKIPSRKIFYILVVISFSLTLISCVTPQVNPSNKSDEYNLLVESVLADPTKYESELAKSLKTTLAKQPENKTQHLFLLNNLAYVYRAQGEYKKAKSVIRKATDIWSQLNNDDSRDRTELANPGAAILRITSSGAVDCSNFMGGTGPVNPDPSTGGDMAQCGPFGTAPIFGACGMFGFGSCGGDDDGGGGNGGGGNGGGGNGGGGNGGGSGGNDDDDDDDDDDGSNDTDFLNECIANDGRSITDNYCTDTECHCCIQPKPNHFSCVQCKRGPNGSLSNGECDRFKILGNTHFLGN